VAASPRSCLFRTFGDCGSALERSASASTWNFQTHREETERQVERLEQVFELIGKPARGKPCQAMQGIIEEGKEVMEDFADSEALDAGLIDAAQAVEHYEICRYGTLRTWAMQLGMRDAARLLEETLEEEKKTDKLLSQLAESAVNQKAA
jgi:ferritin-like metal-binding protein YciE